MAREDEIKLIAYNIWEEENCPNGKDCEHWLRAEAIWEQQQEAKVAKSARIESKPAAVKSGKVMPAKKKSSRT